MMAEGLTNEVQCSAILTLQEECIGSNSVTSIPNGSYIKIIDASDRKSVGVQLDINPLISENFSSDENSFKFDGLHLNLCQNNEDNIYIGQYEKVFAPSACEKGDFGKISKSICNADLNNLAACNRQAQTVSNTAVEQPNVGICSCFICGINLSDTEEKFSYFKSQMLFRMQIPLLHLLSAIVNQTVITNTDPIDLCSKCSVLMNEIDSAFKHLNDLKSQIIDLFTTNERPKLTFHVLGKSSQSDSALRNLNTKQLQPLCKDNTSNLNFDELAKSRPKRGRGSKNYSFSKEKAQDKNKEHKLKSKGGRPRKPFQCKICKRKFISQSFIESHIKKEHKTIASEVNVKNTGTCAANVNSSHRQVAAKDEMSFSIIEVIKRERSDAEKVASDKSSKATHNVVLPEKKPIVRDLQPEFRQLNIGTTHESVSTFEIKTQSRSTFDITNESQSTFRSPNTRLSTYENPNRLRSLFESQIDIGLNQSTYGSSVFETPNEIVGLQFTLESQNKFRQPTLGSPNELSQLALNFVDANDINCSTRPIQPKPQTLVQTNKDGSLLFLMKPTTTETSPTLIKASPGYFNLKAEIITCEICNKTFNDEKRFRMHHIAAHGIRKKRDVDEPPPTKLYKVTGTRKTVSLISQDLKKKDKMYACSLCDEVFDFKYEYESHKDKHLPFNQVGPHEFACSACGLKVASKAAMKMHLHRFHEKKHASKDFLCAKCGYMTNTKRAFSEHLRCHNDSSSHKVHCHLCKKQMLLSSYKIHMLRMHGEAKYPCETCRQKFTIRSDLMRHMNVIHSTIRPYDCSVCGEKFNTTEALRFV